VIRKIFSLLLVICVFGLHAQELNCQVRVNSNQINTTNRQVFQTLQKELFDFMNNTKWTPMTYDLAERIECTFTIQIKEMISTDNFKASIQVQSSRPVYGSSYTTPILNTMDNDVWFEYLEFEALQFNENVHEFNLVSIMAFYAYIIIGMDMETFGNKGGEEYYRIAQKIVINAQADPQATGWKAYDGNRNRYWLIENMFDPEFQPYREAMYLYHLTGLDQMYKDPLEGQRNITLAIDKLKEVHRNQPNSYQLRLFFDAKATEIMNVYKTDNVPDKASIVNSLNQIAPSHSDKWKKITSNN